MATHSSILVWEIPWTEEPCGLQPMGSQRARHDLETKQQPPLPLNSSVGLGQILDSLKGGSVSASLNGHQYMGPFALH